MAERSRPTGSPRCGTGFARARRRELAAHLRAIELHELAAELQERLGRSDRAARARRHAQHARELYEQALAEEEQDRA